jgi:hypothetical protein
MALTPAEKQRRCRERESALARSRPDVMEAAPLQDAERGERGELSELVFPCSRVLGLALRWIAAT